MEQLKYIDVNQIIRHVLFALVVGVACAFGSVILCVCVGRVFEIFSDNKWLVWLLPISGAIQIAAYKLMKLAPNLTTQQVVTQMRGNKRISYLLAPGILLATSLSVLCGGSVGKETGALQIGASLGSSLSKLFGVKSVFKNKETSELYNYSAACGMAACFSALFFAPLGSFFFVVELTGFRKPVITHTITILLACFVAYFIASNIGIGEVIPKVAIPDFNLILAGQCMVIGVVTALVGTLFNSSMKYIHRTTQQISTNYYLWVIIGGVIFALLVALLHWDDFAGTGAETFSAVLKGSFEPWDFAIKAVLTLVCLGFWFKGGEIMPSLCIGGLLGASSTYFTGGDPALSAALGAIAFFAAFSRCPFAALFLGCEIFGWAAAPFLAITIFVSYLFGYPVGMYADDLDQDAHTLLHRAIKKLNHQ